MAANRERVQAALAEVIEPDAGRLRRSPGAVARLLLLFCGANTYGPFGDPDGFDAGPRLVSLLLDGLLIRQDRRQPGGSVDVLIRLLRVHLRPYRNTIALVVLFQFLQTLATLYLPTLNADIIDNGVVKGDTGYIMRIGGGDARHHAAADRRADRRGLLRRPDRHGGRPRRPRPRSSAGCRSSRPARWASSARPSLITRTTNDVQQVQMLVLLTFTLMVSAPIMCVGGIVLALRQDVPLSGLLLVIVPILIVVVALIISRMRPLFRIDAGPHRQGQPGHARADHRHPGDPRVRPRRPRAGPLRRAPTPT